MAVSWGFSPVLYSIIAMPDALDVPLGELWGPIQSRRNFEKKVFRGFSRVLSSSRAKGGDTSYAP